MENLSLVKSKKHPTARSINALIKKGDLYYDSVGCLFSKNPPIKFCTGYAISSDDYREVYSLLMLNINDLIDV